MNRLEIETEVQQVLGLVNQSSTVTADANIRLYVQGKIQAAVDKITQEHKFNFRRKSFSVYLAAPLTGTVAVTIGLKTVTVTGQTPGTSWVGGHLVITGNGFPCQVESVSGQVVTLVEPVMLATNGSVAFTVYFDGALVPVDCGIIMKGTVRIAGNYGLIYLNKEDFERYGSSGGGLSSHTDYGQRSSGGYFASVTTPSIGLPRAYTSWKNVTVSNVNRRLLSVYPYPNAAYAPVWDGWRKPVAIQVTGTATGDSDVPDIPEDFHRSLLVPCVKLDMCEYPGYSLAGDEKQSLQVQYQDGLKNLYNEQRQDDNEFQDFRPAVM